MHKLYNLSLSGRFDQFSHFRFTFTAFIYAASIDWSYREEAWVVCLDP